MKTVNFQPINEAIQVHTHEKLLQALLAKELNVLMSCGGKGLCSTCHVYVQEGEDQLTPMTDREKKTLSYVTGACGKSRLACQARILGEGVTVRLPNGMFVEKEEDIMDLLGQRAETNILHPIDSSILIGEGKFITRSRLRILKDLQVKIEELKNSE